MREKWEPIKVKCYSGYKSNQRPVSFIYKNREYKIEEIVYQGCIRSPLEGALSRREFRVSLKGGELRTLIFDEATEEWYIKV